VLASISINEMAETLRVLAGDNAGNAAHHFAERSYDFGDVASAVLWSGITQMLNRRKRAVNANAERLDIVPIESIREGLAFQDVQYEDVDVEVLAAENASANSDDETECAPLAKPLAAEPLIVTADGQPGPTIAPETAPALDRAA